MNKELKAVRWFCFLLIFTQRNRCPMSIGFFVGKFRKYDHGAKMNQEMYGSKEPPNYSLENITAPVALYYSKDDTLTSWKVSTKEMCSQTGEIRVNCITFPAEGVLENDPAGYKLKHLHTLAYIIQIPTVKFKTHIFIQQKRIVIIFIIIHITSKYICRMLRYS